MTKDHDRLYQQAVARQQWDKAPNLIIKAYRLRDRYRFVRRDGQTLDVTVDCGASHFPVAEVLFEEAD